MYGVFCAGDAQAVFTLQVHHAVGKPKSAQRSKATAERCWSEPVLEQSLYLPAAVGQHSQEDTDALPGKTHTKLLH